MSYVDVHATKSKARVLHYLMGMQEALPSHVWEELPSEYPLGALVADVAKKGIYKMDVDAFYRAIEHARSFPELKRPLFAKLPHRRALGEAFERELGAVRMDSLIVSARITAILDFLAQFTPAEVRPLDTFDTQEVPAVEEKKSLPYWDKPILMEGGRFYRSDSLYNAYVRTGNWEALCYSERVTTSPTKGKVFLALYLPKKTERVEIRRRHPEEGRQVTLATIDFSLGKIDLKDKGCSVLYTETKDKIVVSLVDGVEVAKEEPAKLPPFISSHLSPTHANGKLAWEIEQAHTSALPAPNDWQVSGAGFSWSVVRDDTGLRTYVDGMLTGPQESPEQAEEYEVSLDPELHAEACELALELAASKDAADASEAATKHMIQNNLASVLRRSFCSTEKEQSTMPTEESKIEKILVSENGNVNQKTVKQDCNIDLKDPSTWPVVEYPQLDCRGFEDRCATLLPRVDRSVRIASERALVDKEADGAEIYKDLNKFTVHRQFTYAPAQVQTFYAPEYYEIESVKTAYTHRKFLGYDKKGKKRWEYHHVDTLSSSLFVEFAIPREVEAPTYTDGTACDHACYLSLIHKADNAEALELLQNTLAPFLVSPSVQIRGEEYVVFRGSITKEKLQALAEKTKSTAIPIVDERPVSPTERLYKQSKDLLASLKETCSPYRAAETPDEAFDALCEVRDFLNHLHPTDEQQSNQATEQQSNEDTKDIPLKDLPLSPQELDAFLRSQESDLTEAVKSVNKALTQRGVGFGPQYIALSKEEVRFAEILIEMFSARGWDCRAERREFKVEGEETTRLRDILIFKRK